MCPRRGYVDTSSNATSKRQERDARQQEKKAREKKTYLKKDENAGAFNVQLRAFNLQLRDIVGDGNCLFRSCEFAREERGARAFHFAHPRMRSRRPNGG